MSEMTATDQRKRTSGADARNRQALKLLVMPVEKADGPPAGHSKAINEDPFESLASTGKIIEPPFHMLTLAMLNEQNTELTSIVDTYKTNIEAFGHTLKPRIDLKAVEDEELRDGLKTDVRKEHVRLVNFFNYANLRDSFIDLREKARTDLELTGNAYWEVIRGASGDIQGFTHVPAYQVRLGRQEMDPVETEVKTLQLQEDGSWKIVKVKTWERFRKFVQTRQTLFRSGLHATTGGFKSRWFKEFGDRRIYDNETGDLVEQDKLDNWEDTGEPMPESRRANELIHFKLYSARSPYGLPRYIGNLLSIFGGRAAEEINFVTFRNNNIPSMAIMVSNGQLTSGTLDRIESFVESQIQGSDNYSKFLLLEAETALEGEDAGQIKMEIKPLTREQIKDALFQNYSANNQDNVRRSYRLPPIFVGKSDDYTRATADASRRLADEQVFAPERNQFDEFVNRRLFPEMDVRYHRFKSNSPNTTDNTQLVKILAGAEKTGGMTPEIARLVLEDILGRELPEFPDEDGFNPKLPFSLLMAQAVKNQADPTEPGQQVTALKALGILGEDYDDDTTVDEVLMAHLTRMRKRLERQFETMVEAKFEEGG